MVLTPDFEEVYRNDPDPWEVATSWYERRKTALALALLRREHYPLVWDPACGTGHLALGLAERSDRLVCSDLSAEACRLTTETLSKAGHSPTSADAPHSDAAPVVVERSALPAAPASLAGGRPDLVVLSEVLYYLDADQRAATWALLDQVCHRGTDIIAVHWTLEPEDAHSSGAAAQRELNAHLGTRGWYRLVTHTDIEFVAALWSPTSPAQVGR